MLLVLSKLIYRLSAIPIKMLKVLVILWSQTVDNKVHMEYIQE